MNIEVIGGGSTGLLLSTYLSGQHSVTIYVRREEQRKKITRDGLKLLNCPGRVKIRALHSDYLQEEDCFIICVKQSAVSFIVSLLKETNNNIPLIFLQNGMGHLEDIKALKHPIVLG